MNLLAVRPAQHAGDLGNVLLVLLLVGFLLALGLLELVMKVVQLVVDARGLLVPSVHHLRVCVRRITGPVGTHGLDLGADPLDLALDAPPGLFDSLLSLAKRTLLRGNLICHGSLSLFSSRLTPSLDDIAEEFHDEPLQSESVLS